MHVWDIQVLWKYKARHAKLLPSLRNTLWSEWEVASKCVQKWAHLQSCWQKSDLIFARDSTGSLWTITRPPQFQSLSSITPLGIITKTQRRSFSLLVLTLFSPARHWWCRCLHAGKWDGASMASGSSMSQTFSPWPSGFSTTSTTVTHSQL